MYYVGFAQLFSIFSDPLSLVRDHRAKEVLTAQGIRVHSFNADLLYEPWEVNDDHGHPFTAFSAFWERCLSMPYDPESPLLPPMRITSGVFVQELFLKIILLIQLLGRTILTFAEEINQ